MRDMKGRIDVAQSLVPAVRNASADGTTVDLANYESAVVVFTTGTVTDGTHTPGVEVSDDDVSWDDADPSELVGSLSAFGAADDNAVQRVGYIGIHRYIRAVTTVAGATTGAAIAAVVIRGNARTEPLA